MLLNGVCVMNMMSPGSSLLSGIKHVLGWFIKGKSQVNDSPESKAIGIGKFLEMWQMLHINLLTLVFKQIEENDCGADVVLSFVQKILLALNAIYNQTMRQTIEYRAK